MSEDWATAPSPDAASATSTSAAELKTKFVDVEEWFDQYFRFLYRRKIDARGRMWASEWWRSAEAIARLEAIWRAWEVARLEPGTGISLWFQQHADYHMEFLMDPKTSPFVRSTDTAEVDDPLPHTPVPSGMLNGRVDFHEPLSPASVAREVSGPVPVESIGPQRSPADPE